MTWGTVKVGSLVSVVILLAAVWLRPDPGPGELHRELRAVLRGLVDVEGGPKSGPEGDPAEARPQRLPRRPRIAVGYGACLDVFAQARDILDFQDSQEQPDTISDGLQLMQAYSYFFRHGAAAERFVANSTLFDSLVERASHVQGAKYALGGNAAVMAARFALEGCEVLLAAKMTPRLRRTLPEGVAVVGGEVEKDDVHLILEYKADEPWGPYRAPRANRFILHNDENNPTLSSLEALESSLHSFSPDLLVVGGLQMMDNYPFPPGVREKRIKLASEQMQRQLPSTRVHFELASFAEPKLMKDLLQEILPFADSLGMNEQELANLRSILVHGNVSVVSDSNPRVAMVLDDMRQVFRLARESSKKVAGGRLLTRIHVHTLAYQAILTVQQSAWKNSAAAAAKASLTANRHVCGSSTVDIEKARLIMDDSFSTSQKAGSRRVPLNLTSPVSCWDEEERTVEGGVLHLCVAPVLVCTQAQQTAGGGDNISSAGIAMQI